MKKIILTTIFVVLLITACAFSLAGCDFTTPGEDGKEVEIADAISVVQLGVGKWSESGTWLGMADGPKETAEILTSGMESNTYSNIRLEWNKKVSDKYKITRFTFSFFTTKLDTEFNIQIRGNNLPASEYKQFILTIEPAIEAEQEINFGESGIKTASNVFSEWMHIGAKGINNTPHGYLWKLSNFKIHGIKI